MADTMRAWQYSKIPHTLEKALQLNTSAQKPTTPAKGSGKVLVEVFSAALNPADYKIVELPVIGAFVAKKPATPGMDFAGRVVAAAEGFAEGERVFGRVGGPGTAFGSLGQYVVAPSTAMARLPDSVSFNEGACLGTAAMTAYQTLEPFLPPGGGRCVFVNGASGGVGTFTVQIAKAMGWRVVASCSGANVQLVKDLGADEVIDYRSTDLVTELGKKGRVFDLVVDNVGEPYGLHKACDACVKEGGRMVQVGAGINFGAFLAMLNSALRPRLLGGARTPWKFVGVQDTRPQDLRQLAEWAGSGRIKPVVDTVFPFSDAPRAFEKLRTGRARGKIVVSHDSN